MKGTISDQLRDLGVDRKAADYERAQRLEALPEKYQIMAARVGLEAAEREHLRSQQRRQSPRMQAELRRQINEDSR